MRRWRKKRSETENRCHLPFFQGEMSASGRQRGTNILVCTKLNKTTVNKFQDDTTRRMGNRETQEKEIGTFVLR